MIELNQTELLEKAGDWLTYIEREAENLWSFKFSIPEYYILFNKEADYHRHVKCYERHLERCKRIYNAIINQLQTKNF